MELSLIVYAMIVGLIPLNIFNIKDNIVFHFPPNSEGIASWVAELNRIEYSSL